MITKDNKQTAVAKIMIPVNSRSVQVSLENMTTFFEECENQGLAYSVKELDLCIEELRDLVIDGIDSNLAASELKRPLKFLRELQMFFGVTFYEQ
jgi:hypothetical protein